jgi:hypothetical protein
MSKIIITVEYTYEDVMEHEAMKEADGLVAGLANAVRRWPFGADKASVKSVQVIHQEENKT